MAASSAVIDFVGTPSWRPIASAIRRYGTPSSATAWNVPRHEIISDTPALREREQAKIAGLADALAIALKARGATELQSLLAARTGMTLFALTTVAWLEHPGPGLDERLDLAFHELKGILAATSKADD